MAQTSNDLVLPRPHAPFDSSKCPLPGPSEAAFTETFGTLLPPAKYLKTVDGNAAYYELLPSTPSAEGSSLNGPARILLIHGVQTPALGMFPLARLLQAQFPQSHLVLLELWGHGLSDTPLVPHTTSLFHNLFDALLERLQWPSAHFVGYSFGAALTVQYVVSQPSRVQSFALVAPAGLIPSSGFTAEEHAHLRGDDEVAARQWVIEFLEGGPLVVPADWKERVQKGEIVAQAVKQWQMVEHPGHAATVVAIVRDGGVMDNDAQFAKAVATGIPSIVVLGELDGLSSEQRLKELGFSDVAVVSQAGHGVVRERAPEVASYVTRFWKQLA